MLEDRFGAGRVWCRNPKYYDPEDVAEDVAVAVFLGLRDRARDYLARCKELGIPCVVVDLGWMRRDRGYWQVSYGDLNEPPPIAPGPDRFNHLQLKCYPQVKRNHSTVIIGQIPGDAQHDLADSNSIIRWAQDTAKGIRSRYRLRRIFWRPHPNFVCTIGKPAVMSLPTKNIRDFIFDDQVGSAVVYNSTAGIELLRLGIHVVALGPRTVYSDLVSSSLDEVKGTHPGEQRVRSLLERLAYGQYQLSELNWNTIEQVLRLHNVTGDW